MGSFGGFYKGEKRKYSKEELAKKAKKNQQPGTTFKLPEIIVKKDKNA